MGRFTSLFLMLTICMISYSILSVEGKSQGKNKDKYKKYKTEGNPKEAKNRYSKNSQKSEQVRRKDEIIQEENVDPTNEEQEPQEIPMNQDQEQISKKQKKEKKPYTISVELLQETIPLGSRKTNDKGKKSNKINSEERSDLGSKPQKDLKQKRNKNNQGTAKNSVLSSVEEDTSDFIVHVPKNKKGTRQVLVFQVPVPEDEEEMPAEDVEANAVQNYVSEEQDGTTDECSCEESTVEDEPSYDDASNNMCYYKNSKK